MTSRLLPIILTLRPNRPCPQQTMSQSRRLAEQVASMRASTLTGDTGNAHVNPLRAAEEAAARLNRKLGINTPMPPPSALAPEPPPSGQKELGLAAALRAAAAKAVAAAHQKLERPASRSPPRCVRQAAMEMWGTCLLLLLCRWWQPWRGAHDACWNRVAGQQVCNCLFKV